jgi:hypothetical protein
VLIDTYIGASFSSVALQLFKKFLLPHPFMESTMRNILLICTIATHNYIEMGCAWSLVSTSEVIQCFARILGFNHNSTAVPILQNQRGARSVGGLLALESFRFAEAYINYITNPTGFFPEDDKALKKNGRPPVGALVGREMTMRKRPS